MQRIQKNIRTTNIYVFVILMLVSISLFGCEYAVLKGISLTSHPANIFISEDEDSIEGCEFIKRVSSTAAMGGLLLQNEALEMVINDMTHQAEQAGANALLIRTKSKTFMGSSATGDAYLCKDLKNTARIESDERIKADKNMKLGEKPDLYQELIQLKELKDQGIITDEEFESKKKEILKKY
jgi:hypothetical protein